MEKISSYLSFILNKELFAINVKNVLEVIQSPEITPIPKTSDYIKGIINFRGEVLTVVESRKKFNMPEASKDIEEIIVVLELEVTDIIVKLGVTVDKVKDVIEIKNNDIKPIPDLGLKYNPEFVVGAVKMQEGFLMLLDAERIFSTEEVELLRNND
jgi:purine-binding chemotaxis protein CheW